MGNFSKLYDARRCTYAYFTIKIKKLSLVQGYKYEAICGNRTHYSNEISLLLILTQFGTGSDKERRKRIGITTVQAGCHKIKTKKSEFGGVKSNIKNERVKSHRYKF